MTNYTIEIIATLLHAEIIQVANQHSAIHHLLLDSRKIIHAESSLFFAIKGKHHDGHHYITDAYRKGVRNFMVSEKPNTALLKDANILLVKNGLAALQKLAAHHRTQFDIPVIGITGSNGKTITKEWLYQLLQDNFHIVKSPKSFNSQVGVPLSVWQMNAQHQLAIFEAGISEPDEMDNLQKIILPDIGIFTNIGDAHAEGFLNIKHKVSEKLKLFHQAKIVIYRKDYSEINECIAAVKNQLLQHEDEAKEKFPLFTWSTVSEADIQIISIHKNTGHTLLEALYQKHTYTLEIPFIDDASLENIINCWCVMLYLKLPHELIQNRVKKLSPIAMRLEMKSGKNNCTIINDTYNADIASLTIALDFLEQQNQHQQKTIILSDIYQTGKSLYDLYQEVSSKLHEKKINKLIGIGTEINKYQHLFDALEQTEKYFFPTTASFLEKYHELNFENEMILVKGARIFEFEHISKILEEKKHTTVLEINLNAIAHNLKQYHRLLQPGVKIMAMVKASSYGSGGYEIAKTLQYNRVDYLGVAYADEGVALRKAGITLPIMVMNPEARSFDDIIYYNLEPEIYSLTLLQEFAAALKNRLSLIAADINIHIDVETGMNRLGFHENEIDALLEILKNTPHIKVQSIFSHLAASEDPKEDDYTEKQIATFKKLSNTITASLGYKPMQHILNSAGIARFPHAQFDMVRLGLGLYGIDSTTKHLSLIPVGTLKAAISQIKKLAKGETIGYNRSYKAEKNMTIATISIGYADGLDRRWSNGVGKVLIKGNTAPIVGKICMDMAMVDISHIPHAAEGDEAIIFNEKLTIQEIAAAIGTIPYEILTGISSRVQRIYYQE